MKGIPGSGTVAAQLYSSTGSTLSYSDNSLADNTTAYYYLDITNGASRIITAPVWYSRNDAIVLPISLGAFSVKKLNKSVQLNWSTEQESNSSHFIIERSADGRNWNSIGTIAAAGYSNNHIDYGYYDNAPLNGFNYYRLQLVDRDGKAQFSPVRNIYFDDPLGVIISPNPAKDFINIAVSANNNNTASITIGIIDMSGKMIYQQQTNRSSLQVNTSALNKGMYFVKVIAEGGIITKKIMIQ